MAFVESCCDKGLLISDDVDLNDVDEEAFLNYVNSLSDKPFVIDEKVVEDFKKNGFFDTNIPSNASVEVSSVKLRDKGLSSVEVVKNYPSNNDMKSMSDWFDFYLNRYNKMKGLLQNRFELKNVMSVNSINKLQGKNEVSTIGLVNDVHKTNNDNYIINLEDPTGRITVFIGSSKSKLIRKCERVVLDEVIGIKGSTSSRFLYADELIFPEVPDKPMVKGSKDEYACFIADTHVGSEDFEKKMFVNFTNWLKGKCGSEKQKSIAKKVKYLFVIGDLVDGVGVYPGQENELVIKDIYKQYEVFSDYLKDLPEDIQLIFIPGNHDALRLNEPQPPLFSDIAKPVYELSNVHNLSNPSMVKIGDGAGFKGLKVLMYHGMSYTYYASNVPKLLNKGMDNPELISEFLLKKRHLSPAHEGGLITPGNLDPLLIDDVPDVLTTGHIHKLGYKNYRGVNIIAASCFQKMTSYMQKLGHHPTPGFVPLLNLKTRKVKIMHFK